MSCAARAGGRGAARRGHRGRLHGGRSGARALFPDPSPCPGPAGRAGQARPGQRPRGRTVLRRSFSARSSSAAAACSSPRSRAFSSSTSPCTQKEGGEAAAAGGRCTHGLGGARSGARAEPPTLPKLPPAGAGGIWTAASAAGCGTAASQIPCVLRGGTHQAAARCHQHGGGLAGRAGPAAQQPGPGQAPVGRCLVLDACRACCGEQINTRGQQWRQGRHAGVGAWRCSGSAAPSLGLPRAPLIDFTEVVRVLIDSALPACTVGMVLRLSQAAGLWRGLNSCTPGTCGRRSKRVSLDCTRVLGPLLAIAPLARWERAHQDGWRSSVCTRPHAAQLFG